MPHQQKLIEPQGAGLARLGHGIVHIILTNRPLSQVMSGLDLKLSKAIANWFPPRANPLRNVA